MYVTDDRKAADDVFLVDVALEPQSVLLLEHSARSSPKKTLHRPKHLKNYFKVFFQKYQWSAKTLNIEISSKILIFQSLLLISGNLKKSGLFGGFFGNRNRVRDHIRNIFSSENQWKRSRIIVDSWVDRVRVSDISQKYTREATKICWEALNSLEMHKEKTLFKQKHKKCVTFEVWKMLFCTFLCVHNLYIVMYISFGCWMRLVVCDVECYQPVLWAGLGDIQLDCCQAEGPGRPSWTPPEPTCESTRISPSCTPPSDKLNVDEWPQRSLNIARLFWCVFIYIVHKAF